MSSAKKQKISKAPPSSISQHQTEWGKHLTSYKLKYSAMFQLFQTLYKIKNYESLQQEMVVRNPNTFSITDVCETVESFTSVGVNVCEIVETRLNEFSITNIIKKVEHVLSDDMKMRILQLVIKQTSLWIDVYHTFKCPLYFNGQYFLSFLLGSPDRNLNNILVMLETDKTVQEIHKEKHVFIRLMLTYTNIYNSNMNLYYFHQLYTSYNSELLFTLIKTKKDVDDLFKHGWKPNFLQFFEYLYQPDDQQVNIDSDITISKLKILYDIFWHQQMESKKSLQIKNAMETPFEAHQLFTTNKINGGVVDIAVLKSKYLTHFKTNTDHFYNSMCKHTKLTDEEVKRIQQVNSQFTPELLELFFTILHKSSSMVRNVWTSMYSLHWIEYLNLFKENNWHVMLQLLLYPTTYTTKINCNCQLHILHNKYMKHIIRGSHIQQLCEEEKRCTFNFIHEWPALNPWYISHIRKSKYIYMNENLLVPTILNEKEFHHHPFSIGKLGHVIAITHLFVIFWKANIQIHTILKYGDMLQIWKNRRPSEKEVRNVFQLISKFTFFNPSNNLSVCETLKKLHYELLSIGESDMGVGTRVETLKSQVLRNPLNEFNNPNFADLYLLKDLYQNVYTLLTNHQYIYL